MEFLPKEIEQYSQEHTQKETEVLYNLNRETHLKCLFQECYQVIFKEEF